MRWLALAILVPLASQAQGGFTLLPPMQHARVFHTATRLQDGRVLVAGGVGTDGLSPTPTAERFHPDSNVWSPSGRLLQARSGHSASLLSDGTVLLVGGRSISGVGEFISVAALNSVERYHPKANSFVSAASLTQARSAHSATVLANGDVMIVGGTANGALLSSCEIFRLKSQRFEVLSNLPEGRAYHSAVEFQGSVFIFGGRTKNGTSESLLRYSSKKDRWDTLPSMLESREKTQAVVRTSDVVLVGGQTRSTRTNLSEVFNGKKWQPLENHLSSGLAGHGVVVLAENDLLVIGGETSNSLDSALAQRWIEADKHWCLAGALAVPRKNQTVTILLDSRVLVTGGVSASIAESSAEIWSAQKGECKTPPMLSDGMPLE